MDPQAFSALSPGARPAATPRRLCKARRNPRLWLSIVLTLSGSMLPGEPTMAQSTSPGAEIIMGHSRNDATPKGPTKAKAQGADPPPVSLEFHPKALPPLPPQTYPKKSKRARKHRLDLDRDGYVSRSEVELDLQSRASAFRGADHNQDGKLDAEELRQYQKQIKPR